MKEFRSTTIIFFPGKFVIDTIVPTYNPKTVAINTDEKVTFRESRIISTRFESSSRINFIAI
tara:strand:- start:1618 stop:1803 length:186 start_codon:yes stop_codon:yes gene_type:complete